MLKSLANILQKCLRKLNVVLDEPPFNLILHTAPVQSAPMPQYHWHLEIVPRTSFLAGLELSSGYFVNALLPEEAAKKLRNASV